jgi:carbamoyltransferase
MPQLILAVHNGPHDAGAAVLIDYDLKAAVQLERLTRVKGDGGYPNLAIDETLGMVGATRRDLDVLAVSRGDYPVQYFRHFRGYRWLRERWRTHVQGKTLRWMPRETVRTKSPDVEDFFDVASMRRDCGLRDDPIVHFYNHHQAHALPTLFYTEWDDALLVTSNGGGDTVSHSHRHFANGEIRTIYGGDECLTTPAPIDSLGQAYAAATRAIGFRDSRHEGKLTGLSAMGQPMHASQIGKHSHVDHAGRVHSDFPKSRAMFELLRDVLRRGRREDVAASIQKVLEDTMLTSIRRLPQQNPAATSASQATSSPMCGSTRCWLSSSTSPKFLYSRRWGTKDCRSAAPSHIC